MRTAAGPASLLVVAALLPGCGSPAPQPQVEVFAAASLRKTFTDLAGAFADADSGAAVDLSFAGSADLLTQLTHGADADVFASADIATMTKAAAAGLLAGAPADFASNTLTIAVAPGNPRGVTSFNDLAAVSVSVCAPQVPCGSTLPRLQAETGVRLSPVTEESSVTDVLSRVTSGQVDAGLVYLTDARVAADAVTSVPFPEAAAAVNTYQIAVLKDSRNPALARRFVDLVAGPTGRQVLAASGFGTG